MHYRTDWESEEAASWSTDKSVLRAWSRSQVSGEKSDAVIVERHLRKLARSMAVKRSRTVIGQTGARYRPIVQVPAKNGGVRSDMFVRRYWEQVAVPDQLERRTVDVIDSITGAIDTKIRQVEVPAHIRMIRRRSIGYYTGGSGFLIVNDGRVTGGDIVRLLSVRAKWGLAA